jgi:hypothetical protein
MLFCACEVKWWEWRAYIWVRYPSHFSRTSYLLGSSLVLWYLCGRLAWQSCSRYTTVILCGLYGSLNDLVDSRRKGNLYYWLGSRQNLFIVFVCTSILIYLILSPVRPRDKPSVPLENEVITRLQHFIAWEIYTCNFVHAERLMRYLMPNSLLSREKILVSHKYTYRDYIMARHPSSWQPTTTSALTEWPIAMSSTSPALGSGLHHDRI